MAITRPLHEWNDLPHGLMVNAWPPKCLHCVIAGTTAPLSCRKQKATWLPPCLEDELLDIEHTVNEGY